MKWMPLLLAPLLSACVCTHTEVLEAPQVTATSPKCNQPFMRQAPSVDVTTTTIKFY
jgi:hypothetical protein